jgi:energy-coupling factor transport system permease protein
VPRPLNARAVAAWSAACLFVALSTTNPAYRAAVLGATLATLLGSPGRARARPLLTFVVVTAALGTFLNVVVSHVGTTVIFELPDEIPALGGPYTVEALAFGASTGVTLAATILAVAPFSLQLGPEEILDALPRALSRTGSALAASLNLVPAVGASFAAVSEAQRLRGWRPRGPRSWAEVVVPVVLTAVESSIQLAESMEARGYGSGPRTHLRPPRLGAADWLLVAASGLAALLFALSRATGWATDWYPFPTLAPPEVAAAPLLACLLLFTPVLTTPSPLRGGGSG